MIPGFGFTLIVLGVITFFAPEHPGGMSPNLHHIGLAAIGIGLLALAWSAWVIRTERRSIIDSRGNGAPVRNFIDNDRGHDGYDRY